MYEFFRVIDAEHDDPTIFPVLSAPEAVEPFEWEAADGSQHVRFSTKTVSILRHTGQGWTQVRAFKDISFTVVVTDGRVVVHCEKFDKGGGWRGFGIGGLAFAAVANVVSHARAAARRKGKVLIAQVRYPWLVSVGAPPDKRGRRRTVRLVVDAGDPGDRRLMALDLGLKEQQQPVGLAASIAALAAFSRLSAPSLDPGLAAECQHVADSATARDGSWWELPGAVSVGSAGSIALIAAPPPVPQQPVAIQQTVTADTHARAPLGPESIPEDTSPAAAVTAGQCPACGHAIRVGGLSCGRCGSSLTPPPFGPRSAVAPVGQAADIPTSQLEATTNRATLRNLGDAPTVAHLAPVGETTARPTWVPPPPAASASPGRVLGQGRSGGTPAPEVVLVCLALVVTAGLLLYPALRYGFPVLAHVADSNYLARAFAALFAYVFVLIGGAGAALGLLAVGLWRGSRVAQVLTCVLCALIGIAELAGAQSSFLTSDTSTGIVIGCAAVIGLLLLPGARAFFGQDDQPALGVAVASALSTYLGVCVLLSGLALMAAGGLGAKLVWWGIGLAVGGGVLVGVAGGMRAGMPVARVLASLAFGGVAILGVVVDQQNNNGATASTIISAGMAASGIVVLWFLPSSQQHFARPQAAPLFTRPTAVGLGVATVAALVLSALGFSASASTATPFNASAPVVPSYTETASAYAVPSNPPVTLNADQARATATAAFDAMAGNGYASTCSGNLPQIAITTYTIDQVSPQTSGSFYVSAQVTLNDGSSETVSVLIGQDSSQTPCVDPSSISESNQTPATPAAAGPPSDLPSVPSSGDPVPSGATVPAAPTQHDVVAYDSGHTPTTPAQIVEYRPTGLSTDVTSALDDVVTFIAHINQQNFARAWNDSTDSLLAASPTSDFRTGYRTSRFYQVAFGQPEKVADDLVVIPARFVSRQDPAAQGNPSGVTECTVWPQYVFLVARSGGRWLVDVAAKYTSRSELDPLKRPGSDGGTYLNPVSQRGTC